MKELSIIIITFVFRFFASIGFADIYQYIDTLSEILCYWVTSSTEESRECNSNPAYQLVYS